MLGTRARILLIDDDEVDFVITRKLLAQLGARDYDLEWADSYESGLHALDRHEHDVCLLDYRLGERTGLDLLKDASRRGCGIPIILMTGHGDDEVDREALALGASGFLEKGRLDSRDLDRAVRYALRSEGMVAELLDHNTELLLLHKLTRLLIDPQANYGDAARDISGATGFPLVLIERHVRERGVLVTLGSEGLPDAEPGREVPVDRSPAAEVVRSGVARVEMPFQGEDAGNPQWIQTFVCLPMTHEREQLGVLTLAHPGALPVDSTQVALAASVAGHLARLIARDGGR
jgi:CheY-like chemotaxis protein